MSRNIKLVLAYDGTDFAGWQVQPDQNTIQGTLAAAIERITGEQVLPQGSGRTDAGVHALAQVATFQTNSPIPPANLVIALNDTLPGGDSRSFCRTGRRRVSSARQRESENLSISHFSRRHLFAVSGALRLSPSVSAG